MHFSLNEVSEETIPSAELNDSSYESQTDFNLGKKLKNKSKKMSFSQSTNIQFTIYHLGTIFTI